MVTGIISAAAVIGILDIFTGIFPGVASEKFKAQVDEERTLVRSESPGDDCGGYGYTGCDALVKAIAVGQADVGTCPVGDAPIAEEIGETMGVAGGAAGKKVTFVKCAGTCDKTKVQYNCYGADSCKKVSVVPGAGEKVYVYRCMGYGSCVKACTFDAIHVADDVAMVDKEKCVACGACVASRPNHLTELVPYKAGHLIGCSSHNRGKDVKAVYAVGCIGYTLCTKQCEFDAIYMENSLAAIDYRKCTGCGKCTGKCPIKAIV